MIEANRRCPISEDTSECSSQYNLSIVDFGTASKKVEEMFSKNYIEQNNYYSIYQKSNIKESFLFLDGRNDQSVDEPSDSPSNNCNYVIGSL